MIVLCLWHGNIHQVRNKDFCHRLPGLKRQQSFKDLSFGVAAVSLRYSLTIRCWQIHSDSYVVTLYFLAQLNEWF